MFNVDWSGAVPISEVTRNEWAKELINKLQENPEMEYTYILGGESIVFAAKSGDRIQVFDCKLVRRGETSLEPTEE
jgi:hypothetical protein